MGITILLFFILFMLDQILKFVMVKHGNTPIYIFGDGKGYFIKLNLTYNKGAAFGMGGQESTIFFTIISLLATIALIIICTKFNDWKRNKVQAVALTMTLAGCVGNLYDRFMTSIGVMDGVVDMVYFYPFEWIMEKIHLSYGIFNLADLFLVTGILVFAFDYIFFSERKKRKWQESE
jgi:lipoprotein signal peptidase